MAFSRGVYTCGLCGRPSQSFAPTLFFSLDCGFPLRRFPFVDHLGRKRNGRISAFPLPESGFPLGGRDRDAFRNCGCWRRNFFESSDSPPSLGGRQTDGGHLSLFYSAEFPSWPCWEAIPRGLRMAFFLSPYANACRCFLWRIIGISTRSPPFSEPVVETVPRLGSLDCGSEANRASLSVLFLECFR